MSTEMKQSVTAAIKQVREESCTYQAGDNWIVSTYDDYFGMRRVEDYPSFERAREALTEWRLERVCQLIGYSPEDYSYPCYRANEARGELRDRVGRVIDLIEGN